MIYTERLTIRKQKMSDIEDIYKITSNTDSVRFLGIYKHSSIKELKLLIREISYVMRRKNPYGYIFSITDKKDRVLGMIDVSFFAHKATVTYSLVPGNEGQGYMLEALIAVINWIKNYSKDMMRIQAFVHIENEKSKLLLQKANFYKEGTLRKWLILPNLSNNPVDMECYSILI